MQVDTSAATVLAPALSCYSAAQQGCMQPHTTSGLRANAIRFLSGPRLSCFMATTQGLPL